MPAQTEIDRPIKEPGQERRTTRAGKDSIDHSPGGYDDLANAVAGVANILVDRALYNPARFGSWMKGHLRTFAENENDSTIANPQSAADSAVHPNLIGGPPFRWYPIAKAAPNEAIPMTMR